MARYCHSVYTECLPIHRWNSLECRRRIDNITISALHCACLPLLLCPFTCLMNQQPGSGSSGHASASYANGNVPPGGWHDHPYPFGPPSHPPTMHHGHPASGMHHQQMYNQQGGHTPLPYVPGYGFPAPSPGSVGHGYGSRGFGTPYPNSPSPMSSSGSLDMSFPSPLYENGSNSPFEDNFRAPLPPARPPHGRRAISPINLRRDRSQPPPASQAPVLNAPGRQ